MNVKFYLNIHTIFYIFIFIAVFFIIYLGIKVSINSKTYNTIELYIINNKNSNKLTKIICNKTREDDNFIYCKSKDKNYTIGYNKYYIKIIKKKNFDIF